MNSLKVPESGLLLDGSSDGDSGLPPQAFVLSLSDDVVADLIQSARNGDHLHVALGDTPVRGDLFLFKPSLASLLVSACLSLLLAWEEPCRALYLSFTDFLGTGMLT